MAAVEANPKLYDDGAGGRTTRRDGGFHTGMRALIARLDPKGLQADERFVFVVFVGDQEVLLAADSEAAKMRWVGHIETAKRIYLALSGVALLGHIADGADSATLSAASTAGAGDATASGEASRPARKKRRPPPMTSEALRKVRRRLLLSATRLLLDSPRIGACCRS